MLAYVRLTHSCKPRTDLLTTLTFDTRDLVHGGNGSGQVVVGEKGTGWVEGMSVRIQVFCSLCYNLIYKSDRRISLEISSGLGVEDDVLLRGILNFV